MSGFTHLHLHTQYSLLDGACRLNDLLDRALELGQKAVAITDHGVMYGAVDFYKLAKQKGIKPIIGCEVYVAKRSRFQKEHAFDSERHHLVLLCKNETGYKNLIKMVSEGFVTGFYTKPRIDKELLENHHEGLIALSACLAGEIPSALVNDDYAKAKETALWYANVFGEGNFYLEMQNHGLDEQLKINPYLAKLSEETGIPLVATNDTHYVYQEDSKIQEVLICISTNSVVGESNGLEFQTDEFYLKSEEEMRAVLGQYKNAIENTQVIADQCNVEFEFGHTKLPHFEVPGNRTHYDYFRDQCNAGFLKHYGEHAPAEYRERLEYEFDVINRMGYVDYYLIVYDFIRYAKSVGIPVGPGRGSGAGSIAAYCIGITDIDPMKYQLLFERFLNPERVSMPDFDIDFCYERRNEVIDYVIEKYGYDHVAQIVTFGTMAARAAVRDVGRALGMSYQSVDTVAKLIPHELNITIDKALTKSKELLDLYTANEDTKKLIDTALKVEGMPRHASTHAAGVVITKDTVDSYVPLARNDEAVVTQYTMTTLEELGLLKMDFLGLRTLTVISDCEKMIRKNNPDFSMENIDINDKETFELFSRGLTQGVFQFESAGMKTVLMQLKPENIEDIIAVISLYRPGPMDSIPVYIENRHNPDKVQYKTPLLKDILDVTYGCIVYQEQVMQVFRKLAGYSYGRADIVRRAMSKKKHDVMEKERKNFIYGLVNEDGTVECKGAVQNGVDAETANEIFDQMSSFSQYAFNKSHAAAYALVAYRTAYQKCHYPCEFMAALISSVLDNSSKVSEYIEECIRLKIKVLPPNVNESYEDFTVNGKNILFGLLAIKNLGKGFIKAIIQERENNGKFTSFYSFCRRMYGKEFNRRAVEALIYSGAFDEINGNRRQMINILPVIIKELDSQKRINIEGQMGMFGQQETENDFSEPEMQDAEDFSLNDKLRFEKEYTGIYITGHPLAQYSELFGRLKCDSIADMFSAEETAPFNQSYTDGSYIKVLAIVNSLKRKATRNNDTMAFINIEDMGASMEALVFPKVYAKNMMLLRENNVLVIEGKLSLREEEEPKIIVENVISADDVKHSNPGKPSESRNKGLYLRIANKDCESYRRIQNILNIFDGYTNVYFYFTDSKKLVLQKNRGVDLNKPMLDEMKRIIGEENVRIKE